MSSVFDPLWEALRSRVESDAILAKRGLISLARPAVRIATQRVPLARIEIGHSRIGGIPDVPPGFVWPHWSPNGKLHDKFGEPWHPSAPTPLGFIAQLDLSVIPTVDDALPSSGWLYFFYDRYCEAWGYDPVDRGSCRVIHADCDRAKLVRTTPPVDSDPEHVAEPCLIEAWPELTLPDDLPDVVYGTPTFEVCEQLREELSKPGCQHRLLGHPKLIQNPMELECQLASNGIYCGNPEGYQSDEAKLLEKSAGDWRLLLQIDTDEDGPGWMWGDVGSIYFWIKQRELATRDFGGVWLIFQCC